jgi:cell fate (sporulation/competence/biofilm development) regulator YlbF (YheA/YmcA/DUF963 family)
MDLITMAKEMGKEIQKTGEYAVFMQAKAASDSDEELQKMIEEYNLVRMNYHTEMQMQSRNPDKVAELDGKLKELYGKIMQNENMTKFNLAKNAVDQMMSQVTFVFMQALSGEDMDTLDVEAALSGCSGSCDSCAGCH